MTRKQFTAASQNPKLKDNQNPVYILAGISDELLVQVLSGKLDLNELAKREMENRGKNEKGLFVGFGKEIK